MIAPLPLPSKAASVKNDVGRTKVVEILTTPRLQASYTFILINSSGEYSGQGISVVAGRDEGATKVGDTVDANGWLSGI